VDFRPHELRRTAASHMTSMGISRLTVAKHVERGVTAFTTGTPTRPRSDKHLDA
jgi:hypothetical protein